jgi:sulfur-oxidizing protein SoxZ
LRLNANWLVSLRIAKEFNMATGIKVTVRLKGDVADVKSLIKHPMETGTRQDTDTGEFVPMHHITQITFAHNDTPVLLVDCSTAVSKDPYFRFSFGNASLGDRLEISWVDSRGESGSTETVLA